MASPLRCSRTRRLPNSMRGVTSPGWLTIVRRYRAIASPSCRQRTRERASCNSRAGSPGKDWRARRWSAISCWQGAAALPAAGVVSWEPEARAGRTLGTTAPSATIDAKNVRRIRCPWLANLDCFTAIPTSDGPHMYDALPPAESCEELHHPLKAIKHHQLAVTHVLE